MEQFNLTWEQIEAVLEFVVRNLDRTTHPELPAWNLGFIGSLRRRDLYDGT
jgi:hypothetical protein